MMRQTNRNARTPARGPQAVRLAALSGLVSLAACGSDSILPGAGQGASRAQLQAYTVSGTATLADPGLAVTRRRAMAAPDDFTAQARFASALARAGEPVMAEQIITAALVRSPDHPALVLELARLRLRGGQPAIALALFDRAAGLAPGAEAEEGRGVALDMLGRHAEAQAAYRASLALAPDRVAVQNNLAMSLMLTGHVQEALAVLEPLSHRPDAPARVANNLAIARSMAGDTRPSQVAADDDQLRRAASSLRAALGVAPAQPAPAGAFAAAEPGRGGDSTPLFPLDPARGAPTLAAAPPVMPAPPPLLVQAAPEERALLPASLPPRQPIALPAATELDAPSPAVAPAPVRPVPSSFPLREAAGSGVGAAAPVLAPPPPVAEAAPTLPAAAPAPAEPVAVASAPAAPAAPARAAEPAGFAPMIVTALFVPERAASRGLRAAPDAAPIATDAPSPAPAVIPAVARAASMASGMTVTSVVLPAPPRNAAPSATRPSEARAATPPAAHGSAFVVQVGALPTEGAARAYWSSLRTQLPHSFDGREPILAFAELPHGAFWRLRAGGFENLSDARGFCQALRGHGRDCWVPSN